MGNFENKVMRGSQMKTEKLHLHAIQHRKIKTLPPDDKTNSNSESTFMKQLKINTPNPRRGLGT